MKMFKIKLLEAAINLFTSTSKIKELEKTIDDFKITTANFEKSFTGILTERRELLEAIDQKESELDDWKLMYADLGKLSDKYKAAASIFSGIVIAETIALIIIIIG